LADDLRIGAPLVRKDLAAFGHFGKPGIGYDVEGLTSHLREVLGTDRMWNVVLLGAGALGTAIMRYGELHQKGFRIVAAFDVDPAKIGKAVGGVHVWDLERLEETLADHDVKLAILAVPADQARQTAHRLADAGVQGILNLAPAALELPDGAIVNRMDLTAHLEKLSFQVSHRHARPDNATL
jgi:redox-sensing transcriptional repressor